MRGVIGVMAFALILVIVSLAGECDRRDDQDYELVRAQIYASAPQWAVTR